MMSFESMQKLRDVYLPYEIDAKQVDEVFLRLGNPSIEEIVETANYYMDDPDRNVRVMMLRVLGNQSGQKAAEGILKGLKDGERRVRECAVKCSSNFLGFSFIVEAIKDIAVDEKEKKKIRRIALSYVVRGLEECPERAVDKTFDTLLDDLIKSEQYRMAVLFQLLHLELNDRVEELLKYYVKNGSREEAVMATKALCGYKVINLGDVDEAVRKKIMQTCDLAAKHVSYWVKRDESL